jgi:hypothetical protein
MRARCARRCTSKASKASTYQQAELEAMLHDARTLRTQVYAFAALRYY